MILNDLIQFYQKQQAFVRQKENCIHQVYFLLMKDDEDFLLMRRIRLWLILADILPLQELELFQTYLILI